MSKLTKRQSEILTFLKTWIEDNGYPPTRAEIAKELGFKSPNAAEDHLKALARKGAIEMVPGASRGLKIIDTRDANDVAINDNELPVIGRVAAGEPIFAQQHIESTCPVNPDLFKPRADYLLQVRGMSMKDIGILDGDLLAVHITKEATNGQIIVARIDDDVTVKRYKREGSTVWLLPENSDFEPIKVDLKKQNLTIEGLSVGVIRR
ncbi:MAG TPA: transcriptional repressor LexA [Thiopseudomonas sp.]|nr:transcriptional repressor LexA [Thiopseudomonas sp.]